MKVSVILVTYNHEPFIAQAIDSVLMQEVDFEYEVIILEDCSTDRTREIVQDYRERYPDRIRLCLAEQNRNDNTAEAGIIESVRSPYLAFLDGDDYWTSPHKLQTQAEYLDRHPECSICFHNVWAFYEDGSRPGYHFNDANQKTRSSLEDVLEVNFIAGCAAMVRRSAIGVLPPWFLQVQWGDWPLYILAAQQGTIDYLDDVMGAYRIHGNGVWSRLSEIQQIEEVLHFYQQVNAYLDFSYEKVLRPLIAQCHYGLAEAYASENQVGQARRFIKQSLRECFVNPHVATADLAAVLLKLYAPVLYQGARVFKRVVG